MPWVPGSEKGSLKGWRVWRQTIPAASELSGLCGYPGECCRTETKTQSMIITTPMHQEQYLRLAVYVFSFLITFHNQMINTKSYLVSEKTSNSLQKGPTHYEAPVSVKLSKQNCFKFEFEKSISIIKKFYLIYILIKHRILWQLCINS